MNLGNTIKILRKKKGIKQNMLADKCNISQAYLSQIENNQKEPNLSTLKEISNQLEVPLPIIFYMSLDENDITQDKKEAFNLVNPAIKSMLNEFFANTQNSGN